MLSEKSDGSIPEKIDNGYGTANKVIMIWGFRSYAGLTVHSADPHDPCQKGRNDPAVTQSIAITSMLESSITVAVFSSRTGSRRSDPDPLSRALNFDRFHRSRLLHSPALNSDRAPWREAGSDPPSGENRAIAPYELRAFL